MRDPKLAGDGKLNKAQSFPHIVHSLRMVTQRLSQELKQTMLRDILCGRHSPQSLHVLQSHRIICWVSSVFSLPQWVMFFIPSLPLGIKRWSHGDLSSCLLHQVVVKGPFPSGRKQMSGTLRLLFVILANCLKQSPVFPVGPGMDWGPESRGADPWERWAACRTVGKRRWWGRPGRLGWQGPVSLFDALAFRGSSSSLQDLLFSSPFQSVFISILWPLTALASQVFLLARLALSCGLQAPCPFCVGCSAPSHVAHLLPISTHLLCEALPGYSLKHVSPSPWFLSISLFTMSP